MHHHGDMWGALMGFISTISFGLLGFIHMANVYEAFVLGLIGSIGGWLGKMGIEYLMQFLKITIKLKKKKNEN